MDNILAFVAKAIGATARVGAAIALLAVLVAILRGMNVELLASIEKPVYGAIVAAGIFGACIVGVEFIIAIGGSLRSLFSKFGFRSLRTGIRR
jgi:hypothetical protein